MSFFLVAHCHQNNGSFSSHGEFMKCLTPILCHFAWETDFGCSAMMPLHLLCEWKKEAVGSEDSLAFLSYLWACLLATPANYSKKARISRFPTALWATLYYSPSHRLAIPRMCFLLKATKFSKAGSYPYIYSYSQLHPHTGTQ